MIREPGSVMSRDGITVITQPRSQEGHQKIRPIVSGERGPSQAITRRGCSEASQVLRGDDGRPGLSPPGSGLASITHQAPDSDSRSKLKFLSQPGLSSSCYRGTMTQQCTVRTNSHFVIIRTETDFLCRKIVTPGTI